MQEQRPYREFIPNNRRTFDLQVGDKVKTLVGKEAHFWTVIGIYERVFMCIDRYKAKQSFTKREYLLGEVMLVSRASSWHEKSEW